jgi:hypothetical protein
VVSHVDRAPARFDNVANLTVDTVLGMEDGVFFWMGVGAYMLFDG